MHSLPQTTIEDTSSTVLLIAPQCVFVTQLTAAIESLHLVVKRTDLEDFASFAVSRQGQTILQEGYLCLFVDIPLFVDQGKKKNLVEQVVQTLHTTLHIPIHFVLFDAHHWRKNGREGSDPINVSRWLFEKIPSTIRAAKIFDYHHVLYPYEGGISLAQRIIFEKIQSGNRAQLLGECTPIWYTDVIAHIVSTLYDLSFTGGSFTGKQAIPLYTFEEQLRERSHLPQIQLEPLAFPFVLGDATGIGSTSIATMLDEVSLSTPRPSMVTVSDVQIQKPVFIPQRTLPKTTKKNRTNESLSAGHRDRTWDYRSAVSVHGSVFLHLAGADSHQIAVVCANQRFIG